MRCAELVPDLVADVVDVERVARGAWEARDAAGLVVCAAHHAQARDAAAAGGEDVPDVVVGRADDAVDVGLVLAQHGTAVVVGVGVGGGVGVDQDRVVVDEGETDGELALIDGVHAVDRGDDGGLPLGHGAAVEGGVLAGGGAGESVGAQRGAADAPGVGVLDGLALALGGAEETIEGLGGVVAPVVTGVVGRVALCVRINPVIAVGRKDHGVKALGRHVEANDRGGIVHALTHIGPDLGELGRQARLHHGRLEATERPKPAIGPGDDDLFGEAEIERKSLHRDRIEMRLQRCIIELEGGEARGTDPAFAGLDPGRHRLQRCPGRLLRPRDRRGRNRT